MAIKVIQPSLMEEPRFVASLKAECRRLDKLDHRAIVRFRDLVVGEDMVAMILEHLDGQDLHNFIRAGAVPLARTVDILEVCLDGLAYAHSRQVVHRDIKPRNIFVCKDGRIKLLDFGLARAAQGSQATQTGTLKGTLDYMAPERFSMEGGGAHSDVYALGLVAWELLVGRPACPDGDLAAKLGWHLGVGASDVRTERPNCPEWLADIVQMLVAKDPADRPVDAGAAKTLFAARKQTSSSPMPWQAPTPAYACAPDTVAIDSTAVADAVAAMGRDSAADSDIEDRDQPNEDHLAAVNTVVPPEPEPPPVKQVTEEPAKGPAVEPPAAGPKTPTEPSPRPAVRRRTGLHWVLGCFATVVLAFVVLVLAVVSLVGLSDRDGRWMQEVTCDGWGIYPDDLVPPSPANCVKLGDQYRIGNGVEKDLKRAASLYNQACFGDAGRGCARLGFAYAGGLGIAQDIDRALVQYTRACHALEDSLGCYSLGGAYSEGRGVEKSVSEAVKLYKKACTFGSMAGCTSLGFHYMGGLGVEKDENEAVKLYQKACAGEELMACNNLGVAHKEGEGGLPASLTEAAKRYEQACAGGVMLGCRNWAGLYRNKDYSGFKPEEAERLYKKACDGGHIAGCTDLGRLYAKDLKPVEKQLEKAVSAFQRACDAGSDKDGSDKACFDLAAQYKVDGYSWRFHRWGLPTDYERAGSFYKAVCDRGSLEGCLKLAHFYGDSSNPIQKYSRSKEMLEKLCFEQKYPDACDSLAGDYLVGKSGVPMDVKRAKELRKMAEELRQK